MATTANAQVNGDLHGQDIDRARDHIDDVTGHLVAPSGRATSSAGADVDAGVIDGLVCIGCGRWRPVHRFPLIRWSSTRTTRGQPCADCCHARHLEHLDVVHATRAAERARDR